MKQRTKILVIPLIFLTFGKESIAIKKEEGKVNRSVAGTSATPKAKKGDKNKKEAKKVDTKKVAPPKNRPKDAQKLTPKKATQKPHSATIQVTIGSIDKPKKYGRVNFNMCQAMQILDSLQTDPRIAGPDRLAIGTLMRNMQQANKSISSQAKFKKPYNMPVSYDFSLGELKWLGGSRLFKGGYKALTDASVQKILNLK